MYTLEKVILRIHKYTYYVSYNKKNINLKKEMY